MKLLFDPIYTNDPSFCVMAFKMQTAARLLVEWRDDIFIRFLLPAPANALAKGWTTDESWLFRHPQVEYHQVPAYRDRMKEYYRYADELRWMTTFNGPFWDTDLVLTCRVPMVPHIKTNLTGIRFPAARWSRKVAVIDDMPVMSFKECVGQCVPEVQDLQHVASYLASDLNLFINPWEREQVLQLARQWLAPSRVKELTDKSRHSVPVQIKAVKQKDPLVVAKTHNRQKDFTVGYTQRFEVAHRRSTAVLKTMEQHWIYRGGKGRVRFLCTSNSKVAKTGDVETIGIEFTRPKREEFWRLMREEVDVIIVLTRDDGYALSLLEPLVNGTPAAVYKAPYAVAMLGPDYPFFIQSDGEAYGLVKAFMDDYEGLYARFAEWQTSQLLPRLLERNHQWFPFQIKTFIEEMEAEARTKLPLLTSNNTVVEVLLEQGAEMTLFDAIRAAKQTGDIRHLAAELAERTRDQASTTFATNFNFYRLLLQYLHGYVDASLVPGHLVRKG